MREEDEVGFHVHPDRIALLQGQLREVNFAQHGHLRARAAKVALATAVEIAERLRAVIHHEEDDY